LFVDSCIIGYSPIFQVVRMADICAHLQNYATCYYSINISRVAGGSKEHTVLE
jgi:hypothetical protein